MASNTYLPIVEEVGTDVDVVLGREQMVRDKQEGLGRGECEVTVDQNTEVQND